MLGTSTTHHLAALQGLTLTRRSWALAIGAEIFGAERCRVGEVRVKCQQQRRALLDDADSGMTMTVNPALVPFGLFKPALQIEIVLGEFPLLSHEQPLPKARHDAAHVLPDRIVTRVQLHL